jgi:hypothetical protein
MPGIRPRSVPAGLPFDHPDFPHGERRGRARGCPCDPCAAAQRRYNKEGDVGWHALVPVGPVLVHVKWLLQVEGTTITSIAKAADVERTVVQSIISGRRQFTDPRHARALLAVPRSKVPPTRHSNEQFRWRVMTLVAQGFNERHLHRLAFGRGRTMLCHGAFVTDNRWTRFDPVWEDLRGRWADPVRDGLSARSIREAKERAKKAGFHPSWAYANDYDTEPTFGKMDKHERTAEQRAEMDEAVLPLLAKRWTDEAIGAYFGVPEQVAKECRERIHRRERIAAKRQQQQVAA